MAVQNAQLFQAEIDTVARLQELERLKRDFLAVVSHELRTPATTIIGFADLLASDPPVVADDEVRALASRIALAGRHLTILIDDLLDVAGLSRGNFRIDLREVSVAEVVADVVDARSWQTHEIRVEVADNLPPVIADYLRLNQVLSNLVSNAMKFSTSGSPITISAVADDGHVTIAVADRGVGIPTAEQERIFERFYQVDQSLTREAGGLGIGLFLARQLCQRMGAAIALESEPGAGSRFTVRLRQAGPPD
jgi:signal transduction histidine kinase